MKKFVSFMLGGGIVALIFWFLIFGGNPNCLEFLVVLFCATIGISLAWLT